MKKAGRAMMGSMLFAAVLLGSSAAAEAKTYRVLTNYADSNKTHMIFDTIVKRYQEEVDPDFDVEWEVITSTNNLWDKVRLYLASGDLPDVFNLMNGPIAEEMISGNKLVNMTEALQAEGKYDEMNQAVRDFFTAKDGNVYMLPSGRVAEFFAYRKPLFEKYGLSVPTTWEEFLQVCETLRDNGEVPYVMSGDSADMYLRFLSYPTWSVGGGTFLSGMINQEIHFADDASAMYGAELLQKLGTGDYFIPGYESLTMGDSIDTFIGGTGGITRVNSNYIYLLDEQYEAGEVGYFGIPVPEGMETTGCTFVQHGGKSWAFNQDTYSEDEGFQKFVSFYINHVDEVSYDTGCLSWYDSEIPDGKLSAFMQDIGNELKTQNVGWVSWDDKLQPTTFSTVSDASQQLAHGVITPEEFGETFDEAIEKNQG